MHIFPCSSSQETFFLNETSSPKGLIEGRTDLGYGYGITLIKLAIYTYFLHETLLAFLSQLIFIN
jgi:hypothetical protein